MIGENLLEIDTIYHGGPLFFFLMIKIIIRTKNEATRKLIERIKNLNISNVCGKNVLQVTSLMRRAVTCLGNNLPTGITEIILKVYQTSIQHSIGSLKNGSQYEDYVHCLHHSRNNLHRQFKLPRALRYRYLAGS